MQIRTRQMIFFSEYVTKSRLWKNTGTHDNSRERCLNHEAETAETTESDIMY